MRYRRELPLLPVAFRTPGKDETYRKAYEKGIVDYHHAFLDLYQR